MGIRLGFRKKQHGQITIMTAIMMTTFFLFFAFVINTGMLVNAKINLQNAADMAAYSGAAVQARQLTLLSYFNYEMRRQYKKFLFRYYVMGNLAQDTMYEPDQTGPRQWIPNLQNPTANYNVPAVCIIFNNKDNYCRLSTLGKISVPPASPLDAIQSTLRTQLQRLEGIREKNCLSIGVTNKFVLGMWLWNTDPTFESYESVMSQRDRDILDVVRALASGLGLIPREMILKRRVQTLDYYLNFPPRTGLTKSVVDSIGGEGDTAARERIIQAFKSAYDTLGHNTFDDNTIVMDEIMAKRQINLRPVNVNFDAYAVDFQLDRPDSSNARDCIAQPVPFTVKANIPVGFRKDPAYLTYYAVRLKAKAKILFSPFGDMELTAYAAAKPFGSRIAPNILDSSEFIRPARDGRICQNTSLDCTGFVPNLPVKEADSPVRGWNENDVLQAMFNLFRNNGGTDGATGGGTQVRIDAQAMAKAYQGAMVPNPFEAGKYNIINDFNADQFVNNFGAGQYRSVWAPLISTDELAQGVNPDDIMKDAIDQLTAPAVLNPDSPTVFDQNFKDLLKRGINGYLARLRQGGGTDDAGVGEGFNVARLVNPFNTRPESGASTRINLPPVIMMNTADQVKSSWSYVKDASLQIAGRTGYSVKFVSFRMLFNPSGATSNGTDTWTNPPEAMDANMEQELQRIAH